MLEKYNEYKIAICDASVGGQNKIPLVDINNVYGFDTDRFFKTFCIGRTRASVDIILSTLKNKYFVEFKSGNYLWIDNDYEKINDKISFILIKYFGDNDDKIGASKINNFFYLVIKDSLQQTTLQLNIGSMQSYSKNRIKGMDHIYKIINKYVGFCFKNADIITASKFKNFVTSLKNMWI